MKTNKEITQEYPTASGLMLTIPAGIEVMFVEGNGGGYAIKNTADLIKAGAWKHDTEHRYFYIPAEAVADLPANAKHIRPPIALKSDNWKDTADHWLVDINGEKFDYYSGIGHRKIVAHHREYKTISEAQKHGLETLLRVTRPQTPKRDDVLHCLLSEASAAETTFEDWCADMGMDTDSRKALEVYHQCQQIAGKLRKAKINVEAERKRLQDY